MTDQRPKIAALVADAFQEKEYLFPKIALNEAGYQVGPREVEVLVKAFEDALRELQLSDREDPVTLTVAKRIIELANQGERDPVRLRDRALESLRS